MKYIHLTTRARLIKLIDTLEELIQIPNISAEVIKDYMNQIEECKKQIKEVNKHRILLRNINGKLK